MVRPSLRRMKKVAKKTPGGRIKMQYRHKVYSKQKCAICKSLLHGTPSGSPASIAKLTKSQRRPTRPFGGQLCSKCSRKVLAMKAKYNLKLIKEEDIPVLLKNYVIGGE